MKSRVFATLVAASVAAAMAAGVHAAEVKAATFKQLDTDHDSRVSGAEAQSYNALSETFKNADVNQDGFLTEREYAQWLKTGTKPDTK